ncbi:ROK family protein [Cohnella silvisoli]|uniref:ROK family protein n=1 Tax=Cohnella silvisoli TaxID=2873699 RepID=A0ABV1KU28_9BACL|nr:ROK family protein [Cohnella silvisoli]MCD9023225.1 ROK family protein [Cohnella silvisoli]
MTILAGVDIGGTKCAVSLGRIQGTQIELIARSSWPTSSSPQHMIDRLMNELEEKLNELESSELSAIGISCGGPLDSKSGMILSPPNLPNWDRINIVQPFKEKFKVPVGLQNDANACALAEWQWGAGQGSSNMIFLTFGTGMGAGLILNGRLYAGTNDMAGEIGHIRLEDDGPIGYGKAGSFEGFCSGGGIAQLAQSMVRERLMRGLPVSFCQSEHEIAMMTAQQVGEAVRKGDPLALDIFDIVGRQLGRGLAILVDLLNPELIVIGSIYARQQPLLENKVMEVLRRECLPVSLSVCRVVPAMLSENVGDYASLSVAMHILMKDT